jgi:hypothetical protein
MNDLLI